MSGDTARARAAAGPCSGSVCLRPAWLRRWAGVAVDAAAAVDRSHFRSPDVPRRRDMMERCVRRTRLVRGPIVCAVCSVCTAPPMCVGIMGISAPAAWKVRGSYLH